MTDDDYKRRTVGTILKPIEDPDSVKFQTNGKKIRGSSILKNEIVDVDDDNGIISEQDVYQKMILRLK